jgi:hypothetical protein
MADTRDLAMILNAHIPLIAVESADERRVLALLLRLAMERQLGFYEWRATRGLELGGFGDAPDRGDALTDPEAVLAHVATTPGPALYALCDFHPYLKDAPKVIRYLKDIALEHERLGNSIVLVSHALDVPAELGRVCAKFDLRLPSDEELMSLVRAQAKAWADKHPGQRVRTDQATLDKLVANLRGVSHADAQVLIRHAVWDDGAITESDIPEVNRLKFELMDSEGVLHFEYDTETLANVAGLDNLKSWLALRRHAFLDAQQDRPRGMLLVGVQGGGKSLAAKAVAGTLGHAAVAAGLRHPLQQVLRRDRAQPARLPGGRRRPWRPACCGSTRSRRVSPPALTTTAPRSGCWAPCSPGWPRTQAGIHRRHRQRHRRSCRRS